jgi:hypothetical protein
MWSYWRSDIFLTRIRSHIDLFQWGLTLCGARCRGYTKSMKTAISLPDDVFRDAERYAKRANKSRSQVFSEAVSEYLARRSTDAVTESLNTVVDSLGPKADMFASKAAKAALKRVEW